MQSIYFDLTRIKKLYFDSSYFYLFCLYTCYYWNRGFKSHFLHLFFLEIYFIIFNSYDIVMTEYMHTMLALCILNDYVSFYKVFFIRSYLLKVSSRAVIPNPDHSGSSACRALIAPPLRLAKLGIGCPYMSIFIHSGIEIILKYFLWVLV